MVKVSSKPSIISSAILEQAQLAVTKSAVSSRAVFFSKSVGEGDRGTVIFPVNAITG